MRLLRIILTLIACSLAGGAVAQELCDLTDQIGLSDPASLVPGVGHAADGLVYWSSGGVLYILDEASLELVAELDLAVSDAAGLAVRDGVAFLSADDRFLSVDITNPSSPVLVSESPLPSGTVLATTNGIVVHTRQRLYSIEVSDPSAPLVSDQFVFPTALSFNAQSDASGNFVFVPSDQAGLRIFDVTDPNQIVLRQTFVATDGSGPGARPVICVSIIGDTAFIGFTQFDSIWTLDISRPTVPVRTGVFAPEKSVRWMQSRDGLLFARQSAFESGMLVFDITDPSQPTQVLDTVDFYRPLRFWVGGSLLVGIDWTARFVALGIDRCEEPCPADFAPPFGELNFFDVSAFLAAFAAQDPAADLAAPYGVWDFFDVVAYLDLFNAGCPEDR